VALLLLASLRSTEELKMGPRLSMAGSTAFAVIAAGMACAVESKRKLNSSRVPTKKYFILMTIKLYNSFDLNGSEYYK